MEGLFWFGLAGVAYAYFGYPLVLLVWGRLFPRPVRRESNLLPTVSVVMPVHNEESQLAAKLDNLLQLEYPEHKLEILVVSDGSTDATAAIATRYGAQDPRVRLVRVDERRGKGHALNRGIAAAGHEIVVFTDAGIVLEQESLRAIVAPFADPAVGCVSGEDQIAEIGGEGLYGRYELFLRQQESRIHSLVGASGSFYAQRRELCPEFAEGSAPDFLSVLHVIDRGYRAISEPSARGRMKAVEEHRDEFRRKVRTLIRGMTALSRYVHLLNPLRHGIFAFFLFSHKLMRWFVPVFLLAMLVGNLALLDRFFYAALALPHSLFYLVGIAFLFGLPPFQRFLPGRVAGYFVNVNCAIAVAWWQFLGGTRQEIWSPSRR
jgi:cellulose synthase/poly-beta-1,6-N-acetylglucosamine synthase-like glycosyltransferase